MRKRVDTKTEKILPSPQYQEILVDYNTQQLIYVMKDGVPTLFFKGNSITQKYFPTAFI